MRSRAWGRLRVGLVVFLASAAVALLAALQQTGSDRNYSLDNGNQNGVRAWGNIATRYGADVQQVESWDVVLNSVRPGDTVVFTDPSPLAGRHWAELARKTPDLHLVLFAPDLITTDSLGLQVAVVAQESPGLLDPACNAPAARTAGRATAAGTFYETLDANPRYTMQSCYPGERGFAYIEATANAPADTTAASAGTVFSRVTLVGQPQIFANGLLIQQGNAALALHTAASERVLWYLPDPLDFVDEAEQLSLSELIPEGLWVVLAQITLVAVAYIFYRGRRLGAPVTEPLAVTVPSTETIIGRGQLYRDVGGYQECALLLRDAALRRIGRKLGHRVAAHSNAEQRAEIAAVAQRVLGAAQGPRTWDASALLVDPKVTTATELMEFTQALDELQDQIDSPLPPRTD